MISNVLNVDSAEEVERRRGEGRGGREFVLCPRK